MVRVNLESSIPSEALENKGVRITEVSARGIQFKSPYRIVNRNDLNAKSEIPSLERIFGDSPIFLFEEPFNSEGIKDFVSNSDASRKLFDRMERSFGQSQRAKLNLFLPAWNRNKKAVEELYSNHQLLENFVYSTLRMQKLLKMEILSVPIIIPYDAGPEISLDYIKKAIKKSDCNDDQLALVIDMKVKNSETIRRILNEFAGGENDLVPTILFRHQPESSAIPAYRVLNEMRDIEHSSFLFVDIEDRATKDSLSTAHEAELQWGEGYTTRFRGRFNPNFGGVPRIPDPYELSFFRKDLGIMKMREILGNGENLEAIHQDYYIDSIVDRLNSHSAPPDIMKAASAYSKLHELHLSSNELKASRKFLRSSTVDDYINEKWRLRSHFGR